MTNSGGSGGESAAAVRRPKVAFLWEPADDVRLRLAHAVDTLGADAVFASEEAARVRAVTGAKVVVGWRIPEPVLEAATDMELFVTPAAGVHLLLPAFRGLRAGGRRVLLANSHGNAPLVAQHALALLLALAGGVVAHDRWMRSGLWRRGDDEWATRPIASRRIGLLGYGAINREVERLVSPFRCAAVALTSAAGKAEVADFFRTVDTVVIAAPLTDRTKGMVGGPELSALGPDGLLVNVARGPIIDQDALYEALRTRAIGGAALDVWYDYDPEPDAEGRRFPYAHPFHELETVILSPHRAASPMGDDGRWQDVIDAVSEFMAGREPRNLVDLDRGY